MFIKLEQNIFVHKTHRKKFTEHNLRHIGKAIVFLTSKTVLAEQTK